MERLIALPFDLDRIVALIQSRRWEPAAEAMLLVLCAHEFGIDRLERAIDPVFVRRRWEERMRAEWKRRAERPRELAVMSTRYPAGRTGEESQRFVDAQLAFIDRDVTGKDVVEIGCGTGRLTTHLVSTAGRLTCIDLSEAMLARNRETVGEAAKRIRYVNSFGQDYGRETRHDVALCSMVFVHNVDDVEFSRLAQALANAADVLFLFEHVDAPDTPHEHTRIRSEDELLAAFRGFGVSRRREYALFQDRVLFLKLIRERQEG
jgi:SAM-dependent methyltransferase